MTLVLRISIFCAYCIGNLAHAQEAWRIAAYDAPTSFEENLIRLDSSVEVLTAPNQAIGNVNMSVYFVFGSTKLDLPISTNEILNIQHVLDSSEDGFLLRARVNGDGEDDEILVVDLDRTERSIEFAGCLAALEVLRAKYAKQLFSVDEMNAVCSRRTLASS